MLEKLFYKKLCKSNMKSMMERAFLVAWFFFIEKNNKIYFWSTYFFLISK